MSQTTNDEIDLGYLLDKLNGVFKNISISIYNSIQFFIRNWYIVLGLLIAGVVLGYFSEKDSYPSKSATLILRTNFNTTEYTYSALQTLLEKSKSRDTIFLTENGFRTDSLEIRNIETTPLINFGEISQRFDPNDRVLESLLRHIEFKDDEAVSESFFSEYLHHEVLLALSSSADEKTIKRIIDYLNNNPYIKDLASTGLNSLKQNITQNEFTIRQIDSTLANYYKNNSLPSANNQMFVVDKNYSFDKIIEKKNILLEVNKTLREDIVYSDNAIVEINNSNVVNVFTPIYFKKFILYPIFFVFLFLLTAWFQKRYKKLKKLVISQE